MLAALSILLVVAVVEAAVIIVLLTPAGEGHHFAEGTPRPLPRPLDDIDLAVAGRRSEIRRRSRSISPWAPSPRSTHQ